MHLSPHSLACITHKDSPTCILIWLISEQNHPYTLINNWKKAIQNIYTSLTSDTTSFFVEFYWKGRRQRRKSTTFFSEPCRRRRRRQTSKVEGGKQCERRREDPTNFSFCQRWCRHHSLLAKDDVDIIHLFPINYIKSPSLTPHPCHHEFEFINFPLKGIVNHYYIFFAYKNYPRILPYQNNFSLCKLITRKNHHSF